MPTGQDDRKAASPLRDSLFAYLEGGKLLKPKGSKDAVAPKIGESSVIS